MYVSVCVYVIVCVCVCVYVCGVHLCVCIQPMGEFCASDREAHEGTHCLDGLLKTNDCMTTQHASKTVIIDKWSEQMYLLSISQLLAQCRLAALPTHTYFRK